MAMPSFSTLYFGYGSNLSPATTKQRCPDCVSAGLARLADWKWIINETGYANIVPSRGDVVYGALAFLTQRDEAALDTSEGVPWLYEKHYLAVERLGPRGEVLGTAEALAYVDVRNVGEGRVEREYVVWINKAVRDVRVLGGGGLPREYVEGALRRFVPEAEEGTKEQEIMMVRTRYRTYEVGMPRAFNTGVTEREYLGAARGKVG